MTTTDDERTWLETVRLEREYWRAVTRFLQDYQESCGPGAAKLERQPEPGRGAGPAEGPPYRSPRQAAKAATRLRADATTASERARWARKDARSAAGDLNAARAALEQARPWQWRRRARLRDQVTREDARLAAALRDIGECSASYDLSLQQARDAEQASVALKRSDRAHLAAAAAADRALGWRPGDPPVSRPTVYVAGQNGIERRRP